MRMRKLLSYLSYIGIPFISVCSSYAQYPDGKDLLERLGVKFDENGNFKYIGKYEQGVLEGVVQEHTRLGQALCPGRPDVVLLEHFQEV